MFRVAGAYHLPRNTRLPGYAEAWELIREGVQAKIKPDHETPVVKTGIILIWNEQKGFGWVEDGETRLFFHSREFPGINLKEGGAQLLGRHRHEGASVRKIAPVLRLRADLGFLMAVARRAAGCAGHGANACPGCHGDGRLRR